MSQTPTAPTLPAPALEATQAAFIEALTEEARIARALELTRVDLARLELEHKRATADAGVCRAALYTAVVAEVAAADAIDAAAEAEATA